jgi:hypothetical protein
MITRGDITNKLKELKKITKPNGKKHTKNEVKELIQLWLQDKKDEGEVFGQVKEYKYITKDDKGKDIVQIKNIEKNVVQRIMSDLESYSEFNSITDIK